MYQSHLPVTTLREEPADAEVPSHALMARAGFLQKLVSGVYVYGPMLWRVIRRIEGIVREEHDRAGCVEMLMPALQPMELWVESGRWDRYVRDGILFHFRDRKGSEMCLGPTHEEVVTDYARRMIQSWRQLPVTVYQIQTKFRDEIRPRFGLMRGREFLMKDAYSFDADEEGMRESYSRMREVYKNVFHRCGLRFTIVHADSGAIGGSASEEFMVDAVTGEDAIAVCEETGYSANVETARFRIPNPPPEVEERPMRREATPGAKSCEQLRELFPEIPLEQMVKTVLYHVTWPDREGLVAVLIRGDREVNEVKLTNHLLALKVELADEDEIRRVTGAEPGFAGPIGLPEEVRVVADGSVQGVCGFLCGANVTDEHLLDVWFGRDLPEPEIADLGMVQEGDLTPDGKGVIRITRGIEVGHVFQLGTKYSDAMNAVYTCRNGHQRPLWMGCYGIGVSRIAAAAIEQNHDEHGMIWPLPIAPYAVHVVELKSGGKDPAEDLLASRIHDELEARGVDALWDDRGNVSPGVKFKDADLFGIPLRIVVGRDAHEGKVEWSLRTDPRDKETIPWEEAVERAVAACREAGRLGAPRTPAPV